jgi:two-component system, LytTR family, response regulator AlgR
MTQSALKVLIVDDEALARARLVTLLGDCTVPTELIGQAGQAVQAMQALQRERVDLVFLDIHMPGADGITLARAIRHLPHPPAVVFITAHSEHAVEAFELEASDYLTKPVRAERLQQALQKVSRARHSVAAADAVSGNDEKHVIIQDRGRTERLPLAEVLYFKAELKYITVRTVSRSYILDGSLGELEARYGPQFMRVHRNALVARRAMRALEKQFDPEEGDGWAVRLTGVDEVLAVSRRQLSAVREVIAS